MKTSIIFLLVVLLCLSCTFHTVAQSHDFQFEQFNTEQGLSHSCISCIFQDSKGFMWFGTEAGLDKYDGYKITEYFHDISDSNSISHNFIRIIFEDPADSGRVLWIGTKGGGLNKYDREKDQFTTYQNIPNDTTSLSHNEVKCIYKDSNGTFWVGTEGGGLNIFDKVSGKFIRCQYSYDPSDSCSLLGEYVLAICEDYKGFLWLAVGGAGLDMFDPKTGKYYHHRYDPKNPNDLPYNTFTVYEDRKHTLWIGTQHGLRIYDRETDRILPYPFKDPSANVLKNATIWKICEDNTGMLWITTLGNGLFRMDRERDEVSNFNYIKTDPSSLCGNLISDICWDRSGIIWVGTYCYGITKLIPDYKKFKHYQYIPGDPSSLSHNTVSSICEDSAGTLWIGTQGGGLNKFNRVMQKFTGYNCNSYEKINDVKITSSGKLWIASGNGLSVFDPETEKFTDCREEFKAYHPSATRYLESKIRKNHGLASIQNVGNNKNITQEFEIFRTTPVLIVALGESANNNLVDYGWLEKKAENKTVWKMEFEKTKYAGGSFQNRIQLSILSLSPGKYQLRNISDVAHSYTTWIFEAPNFEELWGISVYPVSDTEIEEVRSLLELEYYSSHTDITMGELLCIYQTRPDIIWCLFEGGGLFKYDYKNSHFIPYNNLPEFINTKFSLVFEDRSGILWFGTTDKGLIKRVPVADHPGTGKSYRYVQYGRSLENPNSISSNTINTILEDKEGSLWIATDMGLNKYDPELDSFIHFRKKDGLPSDLINEMLEDDKGNLWLSTNNGLSKFNPKTHLFKSIGRKFGQIAFGKNKKGEMFFGGGNGFTILHPNSIRDNLTIPAVRLTNFYLFNKPVYPGSNSVLHKAISETSEIILSYDQNSFSLEFSALDYTDPEQNQYAYKMEGVDPDWVYTDASRRFATYTRLLPGTYVFNVKGCNNDGIWNEKGTTVKIIIAPPFWKTSWAYGLYLLSIISLVYGTWRFQLKRIKMKHQLEVEHLHAEKLAEVDRLKSHFFANISHEFRTPLTLILGPITKMISQTRRLDFRENLSMMRRNALRLQRLINQLLDLSKIEAGKMKLEVRETELVSFINRVVQSFESRAKLRNIQLTLSTEIPVIMGYIDQEKVENILYNLLSNALKFTPESGKVVVCMTLDKKVTERSDGRIDYIGLSVSDTGIGIPAEKIQRIFDRFYQVDNSARPDEGGSGIGLALTRELVDFHKGEITVSSAVGKGTTFIVSLPITRTVYREEEIIAVAAGQEAPETDKPMKKEESFEGEHLRLQSAKSAIKKSLPILLVVEDNQDMRAYIRSNLEDYYIIIDAENGEIGFEQAVEKMPELIISDVMMPKMDGFEFCQKIRTDERTSHIPVILLTARAAQEDKIEGLETGADDYIRKPFDAKELHIRVKNLIEQRRRLRERFSREITLQPLDITINSTDEKFMQRVIHIIEKELTNPDYDVQTFVRDVGMSRAHLYRKLEALSGQSVKEFIRTIRLKHAAHLLQQHSGTIAEIAFEVGFNNPAYFSECFRRQFGLLPSQFSTTQKQ